jgi:hypothetical protein
MEDEADGIGGVVGNRECLDGDVSHAELRAGEEKAKFLAAIFAAGALDGIGGEGVTIDRGVKFFAEYVEAAGVIDVLVGDKDGVDAGGIDGGIGKPGANLARAEAAIDKKAA